MLADFIPSHVISEADTAEGRQVGAEQPELTPEAMEIFGPRLLRGSMSMSMVQWQGDLY